METTSTLALTNEAIIAQRIRPELPRELSKFNPFWIRLSRKPLGPPYLGEGKFQVDRIPRSIMDDIRCDALDGKSLDEIMIKLTSEYYLFVHAETVCNHIPKDATTKLFSYTKWDTSYIKQFEERNGIFRYKKGVINGDKIKELYKPFIIWAIENGYGYWQIRSLPVAGNTIRQWANKWGYATDERMYTRVPNLTGKQRRTFAEGDDETVYESEVDNGPMIDRSHARLKFKKAFTGDSQIGMDFSQRGADRYDLITVEGAIKFLNRKGFEVTLRPLFIEETVVVETKESA